MIRGIFVFAFALATLVTVALPLSIADAQTKFRLGIDNDALSMDPIASSDNPSIWVQLLLYDTLVRPSVDALKVEPGLAERWSISPDGREYTFVLSEAKFASGRPVTAEDVVFSLQRAASDKSRWGRFFRPIKRFQVLDDRTVKFGLDQPFTPMMANLALFSSAVLPKAEVQKDESAFFAAPNGSGPFVLKRWAKGERIVLAKNPHYWQKGKPYVDEAEIQVIAEDNSRVIKLQAGELDAVIKIPINQVRALQGRPGISTGIADIFRVDFVQLNTRKKPLDDVRVRKALNHAVNREAIVQGILFGTAKLAVSAVPIMTYHNENLKPYAFDPGLAKKLLAEAGYPNGFSITMLLSAGDVTWRQVAAAIQDDLRKVGINLTLRQIEGGTLFTTTKSGNYEMALSYASSDTIDPDQLIGFTSINPERANAFHTEWKSARVNELYELERKTPDGEGRGKMFKEMNAIVHAEAPYIFLYHQNATFAVRSNVEGFRILPTSNWRLEEVRLK